MKNILSLCKIRVAFIRRRQLSAVDLIANRQFHSSASTSVSSDAAPVEPHQEVKPSSKSANKINNPYQSRNIPNPYVKTPETRPASRGEINLLGKQYNDILYKGRGGRALGLSDLRKLLQQCTEPDHVRYAIGAVELYQRKGMDFKEDVNSLFIMACVNGNNPLAASYHILKVR